MCQLIGIEKAKSDVARKEAFEEFVFDIAMRLNMATKHDPLKVPSSPSRRRRAERIRLTLKGWKMNKSTDKFVDTLYLEQLKKNFAL